MPFVDDVMRANIAEDLLDLLNTTGTSLALILEPQVALFVDGENDMLGCH